MNLNPSYLMLSMLFSSFGVGYFIYGKKQGKPLVLLVGIALSVYTFFVSDLTLICVVGVALMALPWLVNRFRGY